ncbi:hypothetical protein C2R54_03725 [Helicobacter pylori]|nr:hypothetical protein C2R54_03725 [Helicobacter pylori]
MVSNSLNVFIAPLKSSFFIINFLAHGCNFIFLLQRQVNQNLPILFIVLELRQALCVAPFLYVFNRDNIAFARASVYP